MDSDHTKVNSEKKSDSKIILRLSLRCVHVLLSLFLFLLCFRGEFITLSMAHYSESKSKLIKELGIEVPTFPELRPKQNKVALSKVESLHNDWKNAFDTILGMLKIINRC